MNLRQKRRTTAHRYQQKFARWYCWRLYLRLLESRRHAAEYAASMLVNYDEGDYVTRGGDDVHLVTRLTDDRFGGEFTCVVAPASAWCAVGDVESNLARRYTRVEYNPTGTAP